MKLLLKKGITSKLLRIFIQDSSVATGAGKTGLTNASVTAYYIREGDASATVISVVSMTVGTFTSSGFKEIDATNMPGLYEIGIPNAVIATGANSVVVMYKGTGIAPVVLEIQLVDVDINDTVRFGLTALPNAAAGANGGLPLGDASGRVDVGRVLGTAQTAKDLGASATQTGDSFVRLGAPAGASVSADIAAAKVDTAAIKVQTDKLAFSVSNQIDANVIDWKGATAPAMTGDAFARLGAPVGASISADIVGVQADTDNIQTRLPAALVGGRMDSSVGAMAANVVTASAIAADAIGASQIATDAIGSNEISAAAVTKIQAGLSTYAGGDTAGTTTLLARIPGTVQPQTGDSFARLGAPSGLSVSADVAAVKSDTATSLSNEATINANVLTRLPTSSYVAPDNTGIALIESDTTNIKTRIPAALTGAGNIKADAQVVSDKTGYALTTGERTSIADATLDRDMATGVDSGGRTVRSALRLLRNKVTSIAGVLTIYKENDTTVDYTAVLTTDASAVPITGVDP